MPRRRDRVRPRLRAHAYVVSVLLALMLLSPGCDSPMIPGRDATDIFAFQLETKPPLVMRWPAGYTIRVFVHPTTSEAQTDLLVRAFENGADAWNTVASFGEFEITRVADLADADAVLTWSDVIPPVETTACPPAITQAV
ncbi:MAG: hypothetical protein L0271_10790, partial [Gemmatimonadetes bacterium]|nr:hypothetical protein [Gemmatimonadota bacterium]